MSSTICVKFKTIGNECVLYTVQTIFLQNNNNGDADATQIRPKARVNKRQL